MRGEDLVRAFGAIAAAMEENRDALCALDGEIGDGDHGVAMALGFGEVKKALAGLENPAPTEVLNTAAKAFLSGVGASSGPLYATAFMRAGASVKGQETVEDPAALIAAMADGIAFRGKANRGDKSMLDAWLPAAEAAAGADAPWTAAAEAAEAAAEATADLQAKIGRAARLGARSVGHRDPGAVSAALLLRTMANTLG